jgi:hypothetical protein
VRCPFCHEESFAKKKKIVEGWKVVGEIEVCALCGSELKTAPSAGSGDEKSDRSKSRLAALLGGEVTEKVTLSGSAERNFCRNCRHFLIHPFKTVCALNDQEVDPMGCCDRFTGQ